MDEDASRASGLDADITASQQTTKEQAVTSQPGRTRRRSRHSTRDLTKGSVRKNLWFLAWPQIAEGFLSVVDQMADLIWAGRLGFQTIAALGVAQTYLMMVMTARMGLDSGMRSMISRAVGAGDIKYANHVLLQSLTLTAALAVVIIVIGVTFAEPLLRLLGVSDGVVAQATDYMRIQFVAMSVMSFQRLTAGALQASGDSLTPLKAATVSRVGHLALSPLFIFGWLMFPEMGIAGAAMANLLAQVAGVGLNVYALTNGSSRLALSIRGYYIDFPLIWRLIRIGAPASVTGMQRASSQLVVVVIVASFGDVAVAAYALARRAENLVNQSARGLGRAAGALAGQNLGANKPDRAKSAMNLALIFVLILTAPVATLFIAWPSGVASFFNSDPEFVSAASTWLRIVAIGYLSMATVQVFTQGLNTSGDTFAPMLITLATVWAIEIPLSFTLSQLTSLGPLGVAWAIVIGMTTRLVVFVWYYSKGKWLKTGKM